ncbi:MAG: response regulator [Calditrichia bacterium]
MSQQNDQSGMSEKDEEMVNELFQSDDGTKSVKSKVSDFLILIVDDQLINRQILSRGLSDLGYKTAEAENGLVALAKMKRTKPDVVLMDIDMPELNGLETTRRNPHCSRMAGHQSADGYRQRQCQKAQTGAVLPGG